MVRAGLLGALGVVVAVGCGKKEEQGNKPTPPEIAAPTSPRSTGSTGAKPTVTAAPASASAKAPAPAPTFKLAAGRSAIPSLEEWDKQKREVTVKGSSALKCETKMVREYLRVSCHGKNDSNGTPTGVKLVRGGREAQAFASAGVVSLILPVVEGTNFEAVFSWTDKSHPLTIKWPKGTPMPTVLGVFEGAKSPLDRSQGSMDAKLCECHKKVFKASSCDELLGAADEDCDRTYGNDCGMLLACSRGEPGAMPSCRPGWLRGPPFGHCFQACGAGKPPCPVGTACESEIPDLAICVPN